MKISDISMIYISDICQANPDLHLLFWCCDMLCEGCIWARYSTVIVPKNWNLFTVNLFLGVTGMWQLARIFK